MVDGEGDSSDAHSLVEEGEQVAHHHQRCPGDAQQDFANALRPFIHVLDPCGSGKKKKEQLVSYFSCETDDFSQGKTKRARRSHGDFEHINIARSYCLKC